MQAAADWHRRFTAQAEWTAQLRRYLIYHLGLDRAARILEVGCGTGAITANTSGYTKASIVGLDINLAYLRLARQNDPHTAFTAGDGLRLPFPAGVFDAVFCHYFLLWVPQPAAALAEMARVARPGGFVIVFAEPDYGARVDYPEALEALGHWQSEALRNQGADPRRGRELAELLHAAGLRDVETGVMGGQWQGKMPAEAVESEWATLEADLRGRVDEQQLAELRAIDHAAWAQGARVLFVPTFYGWGRKGS